MERAIEPRTYRSTEIASRSSRLDASRMDDIADYVAQGRMHGSLNDHDLIEAWVATMKARAGSASKSGQPSDALSTLGYEMEIRKIQAPVDRVDDELSKLVSKVMSNFEELRQSTPLSIRRCYGKIWCQDYKVIFEAALEKLTT
jgi:hypothetical protein